MEHYFNDKSLCLIQKNLVRWTTIYDMFQRFFELREAHAATLLDSDFLGKIKLLNDSRTWFFSAWQRMRQFYSEDQDTGLYRNTFQPTWL